MTQIRTTRIFKDVLQAWVGGKKGILLEGGTYSSKTYSALQAIMVIAQEAIDKLDIDIVSESIPHLKGGCLKDFFNIIEETQEHNPSFNQTDHIYKRKDWKTTLTFLSADNNKALGMRRDILFINEGDTLSWNIARELISRTNRFAIIDWNPRSEFWAHEYYLNDPKWSYSHSTYKDALHVIPPGKREDIEDLGSKDPNYRNVYELGLLGTIEGLVHPFFDQIDELPKGDYFYGMDFGFTNDPTVLTKHVIIGDELFSQELIYETGLTNDEISRKMDLVKVRHNYDEIWADSAEPKSIEEISLKGYNIKPSEKGKGSVDFGIQKVNQYRQRWTKDSLNCIKEQKNFSFIKDKDGAFTDKTTHKWSHGMDSLVSGTKIRTKRGEVRIEDVTMADLVLTRGGWKQVLFSGETASNKEVHTIKFSNGDSITGTPDHEIWINGKGFTPLNTCRYGDIIKVCGRQSNITDVDITVILKHLTGRIGCILGLGHRLNDTSTDRYGLTITGKFLKVARFTIKTIIHSIMSYRTLNVYLLDGITSIIQPLYLSGSESGSGLTSESTRRRLMNGTGQKKAGSGIRFTGDYAGKGENPPRGDARIASKNISAVKLVGQQSSAQTSVNHSQGGEQEETILKRFVSGAVRIFRRTSIGLGIVAPVYVLNVSEPHKDKQPVYDITTSELPEFYANGVLVHNSRRYALASKLVIIGGSNKIAVSGP